MTTFINNRGVPPLPSYYRPATGYVQQTQIPPPSRPIVTDDYERSFLTYLNSSRDSLVNSFMNY